jgi:hypothetical protein
MGYMLVAKMGINFKLHMDSQWMKAYVLIVYTINMKDVDIMVSHHLRLDVGCDKTIYEMKFMKMASLQHNRPSITKYIIL